MSGIVVDASVTLSWCFPDEQTPLSLSVLDRLNAGELALAPAFWSVEVLNSLLIGEKRGRIAREQTLAFLDYLQALSPTSTIYRWSKSVLPFRLSAATTA